MEDVERLRDQFVKETGTDFEWTSALNGGYTNEYTEWLEQTLVKNRVSNSLDDNEFIDNACANFSRDFNSMTEEQKNTQRFLCREWMRAIKNNASYSKLVKVDPTKVRKLNEGL